MDCDPNMNQRCLKGIIIDNEDGAAVGYSGGVIRYAVDGGKVAEG